MSDSETADYVNELLALSTERLITIILTQKRYIAELQSELHITRSELLKKHVSLPVHYMFDLTGHLEKLVRQHNLAVEKLTERQFVEALKQMIAAGDFVKYVRADDNAQTVSYEPFREVEMLRTALAELRSEMDIMRQSLAAAHQHLDAGPPYYGPQVYKKTITQEDLNKAFRDGVRYGDSPTML